MSSKRAKRRKLKRLMCKDKNWYKSKEQAAKASLKYHKKYGGKWLHPYKCRFCQYWHLGHVKKTDYNRKKG